MLVLKLINNLLEFIMKVQSSRNSGALQALSSERRTKPKELTDLKQYFDDKFIRKPGSRLRNLQERVSKDSQITTSSTFPSNFLNIGNQMKDKSIGIKNNLKDKCSSKQSLDTIVRKSQVSEILNSMTKGRSPSLGRLAFPEGPAHRSTTALHSTRPSSSLGKLGHSKTPTMSGKLNFSRDFDGKKLFNNKGKPTTLLEDWLSSTKGAFKTTNTDQIDEKKRKITHIHRVLNMSEVGLGVNKGGNLNNPGKNSYQTLLSKFSMNPPSTFHLNSSRPAQNSGSLLYQKIAGTNSRGGRRAPDNTTSQLLFENQKLFEKKRQAFKEGSLD
jgi:hypothetical protein